MSTFVKVGSYLVNVDAIRYVSPYGTFSSGTIHFGNGNDLKLQFHEPFEEVIAKILAASTAKEKENLPPTPPIREKETNDNNNSRAREKAKRFKKPTVKEVADYIREMRYSFDAAQFVAYYTAVGWKVGRNPMKDWKAACSTWQRRQQSEGKPGRSAAGNPQRRKADNWVGSTEEQRKGLEDAFRV